MKLKRLTAVILTVLMAASVFCMPTASAATPNKHEAEAAELDKIAYTGSDLGSTYTPEATTFKVWAPTASKVSVKLYATGSKAESTKQGVDDALGTYEMTYDETNGIWSVKIEGDFKNVYYTYSVTANSSTKETVDIYAKAVGIEGNRGMVVDLDSTDPEGWENDNYVLVPNQTDASVWEIHVKDFSYDASSGISEANRGKYLAFTETGTTLNNEGKLPTGIDYLKQLGVKYVQINPFYDFASVTEAGSSTQFNWGYDPKNYNAPEGSYSSNPYDGNVRINEVKQMIQALHNAGIGVIMDVVYNHTYSNTTSWFNYTVPYYYYRFTKTGAWSNGSGCGNDTASERAMFRKFMVDSVRYWAEEYHIDGFRFDLMGLHDVEAMNAIRASLDEIDKRLIMYGEGWTLSTSPDSTAPALATQTNASKVSERIGFFNDQIRDGLKGSVFDETGKGYIQGVKTSATDVKAGITANTLSGKWKALAPTQTVTYVSCHDNHTLYDRLVASMYGTETELYSQRYDDLIAMNKLNSAIIFSSQGTPFILAGEELARTKYGDHNSYKSSPDINKIDWNRMTEYQDVMSYYAGMIELRNAYPLFRDPTTDTAKNKLTYAATAAGVIAYTIQDSEQAWKNVAVCFNDTEEAQEVTLKGKTDVPTNWVVVANGDAAGVASLGEISGETVTVPAMSALILVDKESYDAAKIPNNRGIVTIKHVNKTTGELLSQSTVTGPIGSYYTSTANKKFALEYDLTATPENAEGLFTEEGITVTYEYELYSLRGVDVTGDGKVDNHDVLYLQKSFAGYFESPVDADINKDGEVNLKDLLIYQKNLAKIFVSGISEVVVNYLDKETGEPIAPQTVSKARVGESYNMPPKAVNYYVLDETVLPDNAQGICSTTKTEINYYYNYSAVKRTVHVKLMDGQTWIPNLYAWYEDASTKAVNFLGAWPGKRMTAEGDGWYTITFDCGGMFHFIVNSGANQTIDMKNNNSDIWVVMNVAKPNKGENDCTVYTAKPE